MISVVIPTYESSRFITFTLDCLGEQTYKEFETVIVNDGSGDNTSEVVAKYIASHQNLRIRLFNQENRGIAGARNRGIREAKGRYIAFLDHDDIWYPEKLSKCYAVFMRYPEVDLVCNNELIRDALGRIVRRQNYGPYAVDMFRKLLFRGNYLSPSAVVVKREALNDVGLFIENPEFSTVEDYDLWIRLSKNHKFYFIPEVLGEFIMRNTSASSNIEKHYNNFVQMLKKNFSEYKNKRLLDYLLINARIMRIYFILIRYFIKNREFGKCIKYSSIAIKQPLMPKNER